MTATIPFLGIFTPPTDITAAVKKVWFLMNEGPDPGSMMLQFSIVHLFGSLLDQLLFLCLQLFFFFLLVLFQNRFKFLQALVQPFFRHDFSGQRHEFIFFFLHVVVQDFL